MLKNEACCLAFLLDNSMFYVLFRVSYPVRWMLGCWLFACVPSCVTMSRLTVRQSERETVRRHKTGDREQIRHEPESRNLSSSELAFGANIG